MINYFNFFSLLLPLLFWLIFNIGWKVLKNKILTHKFYQKLKNIYGKNYYYFVYIINWLLEFWVIFYYLIYFSINNYLINLTLLFDFSLSWKIPIIFILLLIFNWSFTSFIVFEAFYGYSPKNVKQIQMNYQNSYKKLTTLDFWISKMKFLSRFIFLYWVVIIFIFMFLTSNFVLIYLIASVIYFLFNVFIDPEGGTVIEVIMRCFINSVIYFVAFLILHNILLILCLAIITKLGILKFLKYDSY